jgi:hypothetical protein
MSSGQKIKNSKGRQVKLEIKKKMFKNATL